MPKTIVYLDQNYASSFAKAEYLDSWPDPRRRDFLDTLSVLRHQTREDKLICPTSDFHRRESERSIRVRDFVWRVVDELAFGLRFRSSNDIAYDQMAIAACKYARRCHADMTDWRLAFISDPHASVKARASSPRVLAHIPSADEFTEFEKSGAEAVDRAYSNYKKQRAALGLTYEQEYAHNKKQVARESFWPWNPMPSEADDLASLLAQPGSARLRAQQLQVLALAGAGTPAYEFVESEDLLSCPHIEIRASLMAADIAKSPGKPPTVSLNVDFDIVASFLPYVDILTTDAYMKELMRQSGVLARYPTEVFSMTVEDHVRLTTRLSAL